MPTDTHDVTYKIVRYYADSNHPDHQKIVREGLTLDEAQEHCNRDDTNDPGVWFDGYTRES